VILLYAIPILEYVLVRAVFVLAIAVFVLLAVTIFKTIIHVFWLVNVDVNVFLFGLGNVVILLIIVASVIVGGGVLVISVGIIGTVVGIWVGIPVRII
jgi:hypothetical protein